MTNNSSLEGGDSDPVSILNSGRDYGKYIAFDETSDKDIFGFFEELARYHVLIIELDSLLKGRTSVGESINMKIKDFQSFVSNKAILKKLKSLKSNLTKYYVTSLIKEVSKCDFTLYKEFLSKVKIFQSQSNEESFKGLIEKELQEACKASPRVADFVYQDFERDFLNWWREGEEVVWLHENSELWQAVETYMIDEIKKISEPEIQEIIGCGKLFNQEHVRKLSDAIKQKKPVLNIVTKSNDRILQKKKTYQALNTLPYKNPLFINIRSFVLPRKEFRDFWPSKWSDVLVVDCGSDGNVAQTVLDNLHQSADCGKRVDNSNQNKAETFIDIVQKYQKKVIIISAAKVASGVQQKSPNISYFEDN
jgi:hypothetical protein